MESSNPDALIVQAFAVAILPSTFTGDQTVGLSSAIANAFTAVNASTCKRSTIAKAGLFQPHRMILKQPWSVNGSPIGPARLRDGSMITM